MTITKETTENILGEYANYGFTLKEPDDHILELYHGEKCIARLNQPTATPEIIRQGCRNYLANILR